MKLVLASCLLLAAATSVLASHLTHPHVFPARLRGTPLHKQSLREERDYSASIGHVSNSTPTWVKMPLYHTGQAGEQTFNVRMFYDTSFWNKNQQLGNVGIFYASGEGASTHTPGGYLLDIANMTGALILNCENRFYGESWPSPVNDTAALKAGLKLDYVFEDANSCMTIFENLRNNGQPMKWFVVGGSYSGAISSWLRARYPNRLIWSWSSSGVVHPVFDFSDFDGHVSKMLSAECFANIREGFNQYERLFDADKAALYTPLGGVPSFFSREDTAWMLSDGTAMIVQYGGKTKLCDFMVSRQVQPGGAAANSNNDMLLRMRAAIDMFWGPTWLTSLDSACYYSTECLTDTQYAAHWNAAGRSWVWQCASEFGWWNIGYVGSLRPRMLSTDYFTAQVRSAFQDATLFPSLYDINTANGGQWPYSHATKVIALQGSADPWQTVGVRQDFPSLEYYYKEAYGPDIGHCHDLGSPGPNDSASVIAVRQTIRKYARQWMGMPPEMQEEHQQQRHHSLMEKLIMERNH
jgi:hypothetical protein